jgi:uncharacterized protein (DUF1800 family)
MPKPCDASASPTNGKSGDCGTQLASGKSCQPICNAGYTVSGKTACAAGTLNVAKCHAKSCAAGGSFRLTVGMDTGTGILASQLSSGASTTIPCQNWKRGYRGSIQLDCYLGAITISTSKAHSCKSYNKCASSEDDCAGVGHICTHTGPGTHSCSCGANTFGDGRKSGTQCTKCPANSATSDTKTNTVLSACICSAGYTKAADGSCPPVRCPPYSVGTGGPATGACTCIKGYTGTPVLDKKKNAFAIRSCLAKSCDASLPPANGKAGDCKAVLASGSSCQPTCDKGYRVSGKTSCIEGVTTAARCEARVAGAGGIARVASLSLSGDVSAIPKGSAARTTFEKAFKRDMAKLLGGISLGRIGIVGIAAGSIIVTFTVAPDGNGAALSVSAITAAFNVPGVSVAGAKTTKAVTAASITSRQSCLPGYIAIADTGKLTLGERDGKAPWKGMISDAKIFPSPLPKEVIFQAYVPTRPPSKTPKMGQWVPPVCKMCRVATDLSTKMPFLAVDNGFGKSNPQNANDGKTDRSNRWQYHSTGSSPKFPSHGTRAKTEWLGVQLRNSTINPDFTIFTRSCCNKNNGNKIFVYISDGLPGQTVMAVDGINKKVADGKAKFVRSKPVTGHKKAGVSWIEFPSGNRKTDSALQWKGKSGCSVVKPCDKCSGDCDSDKECKGALLCFQRSGVDQVSGCQSGGTKDHHSQDYCYDPAPIGSLEYTFTCSKPTQVSFKASFAAKWDANDSLFMAVDKSTRQIWETGWTRSTAPKFVTSPQRAGRASPVISVKAGKHTLAISERGRGFALSSISFDSGAGVCKFTNKGQATLAALPDWNKPCLTLGISDNKQFTGKCVGTGSFMYVLSAGPFLNVPEMRVMGCPGGCTPQPPTPTWQQRKPPLGCNHALCEYRWTGGDASRRSYSISWLTRDKRFAGGDAHAAAFAPTEAVGKSSGFFESSLGGKLVGGMMEAFIRAPASGTYTFTAGSTHSDAREVWVATQPNTKSGLKKVITSPGCCRTVKSSAAQSVNWNQGSVYYIRALLKSGHRLNALWLGMQIKGGKTYGKIPVSMLVSPPKALPADIGSPIAVKTAGASFTAAAIVTRTASSDTDFTIIGSQKIRLIVRKGMYAAGFFGVDCLSKQPSKVNQTDLVALVYDKDKDGGRQSIIVNGVEVAVCKNKKKDSTCGKNCVGKWGAFGACSVPCGGGIMRRTYAVSTPSVNGGAECPFDDGAFEQKPCGQGLCKINCIGSWSQYGTCTKQCGGGTQQRLYSVRVTAANGGNVCPSVNGATQTRTCNVNRCHSAFVHSLIDGSTMDAKGEAIVRIAVASSTSLAILSMISKNGVEIQAGRSYSGNAWEGVMPTPLQFDCSAKSYCSVDLSANQAGTGLYKLSVINSIAPKTADQTLSRFLIQSSFGPRKSEIQNIKALAPTVAGSIEKWIQAQMALNATQHRAWMRRYANPRNGELEGSHLRSNPFDEDLSRTLAVGLGRQPCQPGSRWHRYAFTNRDVGSTVDVTKVSTGFLLSIDGIPRTEVSAAAIANFKGRTTVVICSVLEMLGKDVVLGENTSLSHGCVYTMAGSAAGPITMANPQITFSTAPTKMTLSFGKADIVLSQAKFPEFDPDTVFLDQIKVACATPTIADVTYLQHNNVFYKHDVRVLLYDGSHGNSTGFCPRWRGPKKTSFNAHTCVRRPECKTPLQYSGKITLDKATLRNMYTSSAARFVYAVDGLRMEPYVAGGTSAVSPCPKGRTLTVSRWRKAKGACASPTALDNATAASIVKAMQVSKDANPIVRDIKVTGPCTTANNGVSIIGANVTYNGDCWTHVHPETLNVVDFTYFTVAHEWRTNQGHTVGSKLPRRFTKDEMMLNLEPISLVATRDKSVIMPFPPSHPMDEWRVSVSHARSKDPNNKVNLIGKLGDTIDFNKLHLSFQTADFAKLCGVKMVGGGTYDGAEYCGSPGEGANEPKLGHRAGFFLTPRLSATAGSMSRSYCKDMRICPSRSYGDNAARVWANVALTAPDQLRQRVAWALAQTYVIAVGEGVPWSGEVWSAYYDIMVRNSFGNLRDLLKEVSYNPYMAGYLTFLRSASYEMSRTYPDENYSREFMELFTIGLYKLNPDGTHMKDKLGNDINTFDNFDIMEFARVWTGFMPNPERLNQEINTGPFAKNGIDPTYLDERRRDARPKMNLHDGYLGDGFPQCSDMPSRAFLKRGATYSYLGGTEASVPWNGGSNDHRQWRSRNYGYKRRPIASLRASSALAKELSKFSSVLVLDRNLPCDGVECTVDTVQYVKLTHNGETAFYEFQPAACVDMAFFTGKQIRATGWLHCAEPGAMAAGAACCDQVGTTNTHATAGVCEYARERMTFQSAVKRCKKLGKHVCGRFWHQNTAYSKCDTRQDYAWIDRSCTQQVQVDADGLVAIVNAGNLVNYRGRDRWHSAFQPDNKNSFRVAWAGGKFPSPETGCGKSKGCTLHSTKHGKTCICATSVDDQAVFTSLPTAQQALDRLRIGAPAPDLFDKGTYARSALSTADMTVWTWAKPPPPVPKPDVRLLDLPYSQHTYSSVIRNDKAGKGHAQGRLAGGATWWPGSVRGPGSFWMQLTLPGSKPQQVVGVTTMRRAGGGDGLISSIRVQYQQKPGGVWKSVPGCKNLPGAKSPSLLSLPYSKITVSGAHGNNRIGTGCASPRLDSNLGWCVNPAQRKPGASWLQMDMGKVTAVNGVSTKGRNRSNQRVTAFKVSISKDGKSWTPVDGGKTFIGNVARSDVLIKNTFSKPVQARFVRIYPYKYAGGYPTMRVAINMPTRDISGQPKDCEFKVASLRMKGTNSNFPTPVMASAIRILPWSWKARSHPTIKAGLRVQPPPAPAPPPFVPGTLDTRAIFAVKNQQLGRTEYFLNKESTVKIPGFAFRNPGHHVKFHERTPLDAGHETDAMIGHMLEHPNTAPFIAKSLLQRLVTSNPSPRYVLEVANSFRTGTYNGKTYSGKYGDLGAAVAAIYLDREARSTVLDSDPTHGSLREPILKVMHMLRSMEYKSRDGRLLDLHNLQGKIGMEPFKSPSVFNFYMCVHSLSLSLSLCLSFCLCVCKLGVDRHLACGVARWGADISGPDMRHLAQSPTLVLSRLRQH